jgi:hypothetical protein
VKKNVFFDQFCCVGFNALWFIGSQQKRVAKQETSMKQVASKKVKKSKAIP